MNIGPDVAPGVVVTGMVSGTATILGGVSPSAGVCMGGDIDCDVGDLSIGASVTVIVDEVAPTGPESVTVTANAQSTDCEAEEDF